MTVEPLADAAFPIPSTARPASDAPWPSPRVAWYAVFVFALVLMINFLDRGIVGLLMPSIKADLHLTDVQMSYLVGFAFIVIYVFVGLPVARWADVGPRRTIVGIGIGLWSLATAFCGIAQNFWQLFLCRVGTGVGESCGGPATYSMLSDLFPPAKLPRAIAVMSFGFTVGTGLSLIVGGAVLDLIRHLPPLTLPGFGTMKSWQTAFLIVGLPGLIVSALCWTIQEPVRRGRTTAGAKLESAPVMTIVRYLYDNGRIYGPMLLGLAFNTIHSIGTLIWAPTFYARTYGWDPARVGIYSGLVLIIVWPLGSMFGSWLAERWAKEGKHDANLRVVVWAMFLLIPGQVLFPLMPNGWLALGMNAVNGFIAAWVLGPQNAAIQVVTPNEMRGQVTALLIFTINIFGYGLGPTIVALTTTHVFGGDQNLRYSLSLLSGVLGLPAGLAILSGLRAYGAAVARTHHTWS
jgi:MFS family permease